MINLNKHFFEEGEANRWFQRNKSILEKQGDDQSVNLLVDWLRPFQQDIKEILEVGCGSGHVLEQLVRQLDAQGYGAEPSPKAVDYIQTHFPHLNAQVSFGDSLPFEQSFDLVHLGFFLYLVDRSLYLRCISEADRLVKTGGFLSILDFDTPFPYSNHYRHQQGIYSYKQNNSEVFVSSGLYSVVHKYQLSHRQFFFDKDIDERVSLTLLYKEQEIFQPSSDKR